EKIAHIDNAHRIPSTIRVLIHKEFLPESTKLNTLAYAEVLKCLLQRIRRVRPEYAKQGFWKIHDNARPHTALVVRQFLATNGVVTLDHPLIHPIWHSADFFLFPRLKSAPDGKEI
ncbi:mariner Mos1 transposase, partial [Trichonephila clavipes]